MRLKTKCNLRKNNQNGSHKTSPRHTQTNAKLYECACSATECVVFLSVHFDREHDRLHGVLSVPAQPRYGGRPCCRRDFNSKKPLCHMTSSRLTHHHHWRMSRRQSQSIMGIVFFPPHLLVDLNHWTARVEPTHRRPSSPLTAAPLEGGGGPGGPTIEALSPHIPPAPMKLQPSGRPPFCFIVGFVLTLRFA